VTVDAKRHLVWSSEHNHVSRSLWKETSCLGKFFGTFY